VLENFDQCVVQVDPDVLFGALDFRSLLLVQAFCHVSFEVNLDCVHSVDTLFIPRSLVGEEWAQLRGKCFVLGPVLDEVCGHKLLVKDEHREVELLTLVECDALIVNLGELVDALA